MCVLLTREIVVNKSAKLKNILSQAGIDIKTLGSATDEQLQRLLVPYLRMLEMEINAKNGIAEIS